MPPSEMTPTSVGAAADIDDHGAGCVGDRQAGTDGGGHRFLDQEYLAGAGAERGFADGAAFDLVEPDGTQMMMRGSG